MNMIFERSLTLVGASFPDSASARLAKKVLERKPALAGEVVVIGPDDPEMKFDAERTGNWETAIRSHVMLSLAGGVAGAATAWVLSADDWDAAMFGLGYTMLFFAVMGGLAGVLVAVLLTIRPDHRFVIRKLRAALKRRRWAVVVRPLRRSLAREAVTELRRVGAVPLHSL
jgi:hypothetical protein